MREASGVQGLPCERHLLPCERHLECKACERHPECEACLASGSAWPKMGDSQSKLCTPEPPSKFLEPDLTSCLNCVINKRYDGFGGPAKISSDSDVFVAGGEYDYDAMQYRGIILHHDGTGWKKTSQGPRRSLEGIGADIFVIGGEHDGTGQSPGVILHYDGTAWTPMDSGASDYLYGIWGCSGTDILAVGHAGTIMHHDGTDWHEMSSGAEMNLRGVWGSSGSDVFATKQALHSGQSFC